MQVVQPDKYPMAATGINEALTADRVILVDSVKTTDIQLPEHYARRRKEQDF